MSKKKENKKKKTKRKKKKIEEAIPEEEVAIEEEPSSNVAQVIWLIIITVLFIFSLIKIGPFGIVVSNIFSFVFGKLYFVVFFTLLFLLIRKLLFSNTKPLAKTSLIGIIIFNISILMLGSIISYSGYEIIDFDIIKEILVELLNIAKRTADFGGGLIGSLLYVLANVLFDTVGAIIVLIVLFIISGILLVPFDLLKNFFTEVVISKNNNDEQSVVEPNPESSEDYDNLFNKVTIEDIQNDENINSDFTGEIPFSHEEEVLHEEIDDDNDSKETFVKEYFLDADNTQENIITLDKINSALSDYENNNADDSEPLNTNIDINNNDVDNIEKNECEASNEVNNVTNDNVKQVKKPISYRYYKLPKSSDLLSDVINNKSNKNVIYAETRFNELIKILANFGIAAKPIEYHIGPSVTKFEIKPDATVNLSKINSLSDNIKMGLAAKSIRIEAPIPGKNAVGIEIPNAENSPVRMSELINDVPKSEKLSFALGKDLSGKSEHCNLAKMPHLLIAGSTGSGKSVCINTIITSYLLKTKPDELKLVLVDPKKVEFTPYHDVPHLLCPVITDVKMASLMLKRIVGEMDFRYDLFAKAKVREINSYNEKVKDYNANLKPEHEPMRKLPYIVVIIDELADLMQTVKNDVESSITRITQLARASGIHLIVATQRPSTDVITGLIKSNIPSRISFAVSSAIDSRTILDQAGAEELLGNGDMLFSPNGENTPKRIQGCWVTDEEIEAITSYCKEQAMPDYDDSYFAFENNNNQNGSNSSSGEDDSLFDEAKEFIIKTKKASTSSLQRRFGIGYNRAARLIDTFEEMGFIGPANGSKPREVYLKDHDIDKKL